MDFTLDFWILLKDLFNFLLNITVSKSIANLAMASNSSGDAERKAMKESMNQEMFNKSKVNSARSNETNHGSMKQKKRYGMERASLINKRAQPSKMNLNEILNLIPDESEMPIKNEVEYFSVREPAASKSLVTIKKTEDSHNNSHQNQKQSANECKIGAEQRKGLCLEGLSEINLIKDADEPHDTNLKYYAIPRNSTLLETILKKLKRRPTEKPYPYIPIHEVYEDTESSDE